MANPTLLTMPLCVNADKNTIPSTDAGISGAFSEEYGWQNINSLPLASGGKAPNRRDFNGVFALLGGIAYACQRGYTFEWDATQDYVVGCVVLDTNDNKRYECISDVSANATPPNADTTHWKEFGTDTTGLLTREITPAFNTRDIITTSGTYTAPVTGWYKVTVKGAGGGGGGGISGGAAPYGGHGGSEGGTTIAYVSMSAGDTASVVVGGGGAGRANNTRGTNGGDSSVTYNGNTFTGGGGGGGEAGYGLGGNTGMGGSGTIIGAAGGAGGAVKTGGSGGGAGGGSGASEGHPATEPTANSGGGGGGGTNNLSGATGADGFVWFEYFANI